MHGDFTRDTFDRKRHYSSVRQQQGRVQLDADFNEQADLALYRERTVDRDEIGAVGVPYADPAQFQHFQVRGATLPALEVAPGRIYVAGILVENDVTPAAPLNAQPHLPADAPIVEDGDNLLALAAAPDGQYAVYLQVAEREVTAIEDPTLREPALGGPDTTTRVQTVWQVRLRHTDGNQNCVSAQALLPSPSRGRLTSGVQPVAGPDDPCQPGGGGGYLGLENHLYRVEIHAGGALGAATWKWSRENGSVLVAVDDFIREPAAPNDAFKIIVSTLGRDAVLGLGQGDWVEFVDDPTVQLGQTGTLAQIADITSAADGGYVVRLSQAVTAHIPPGPDPTVWRSRLRRWDQTKNLAADRTLLTGAGPLDLEDGVQVEFSVDPTGSGPDFRTGDYWIFAARTRGSSGQVEQLAAAPPRGRQWSALLALATQAGGALTIGDCRPQFPPATDLVNLLYVGGDGQQAPSGQALPAPLQVSVTRGRFPVPGARVQFTVQTGAGTLDASPVATGPDGVAQCRLTLDAATALQVVEARLLLPDDSPAPNPPIRFSATLAAAGGSGGTCTSVGPTGDFPDLDTALSALLAAGTREICVCLAAGTYPLSVLQVTRGLKDGPLHIRIGGCGPNTVIRLEKPLLLSGVTSFHLDAVAVQLAFEASGLPGALGFDSCDLVSLTDCRIAGRTAADDQQAQGALVSLAATASVRLRDVRLEAWTGNTFAALVRALRDVGADIVAAAMGAAEEEPKFQEAALETGAALAGLSAADRERLTGALRNLGQEKDLSAAEQVEFGRLAQALQNAERPLEDYAALLIAIRRTAVKARPGAALVLGALPADESPDKLPFGPLDRDNFQSIENCAIAGEIGLYGLPITPAFFDTQMNVDGLALFQRALRAGLAFGGRALALGSLALRGNQITRIGLAAPVVEAFNKRFDVATLLGFFNELLLTDNIFESSPIIVAALHCGLTGNQFLSSTRGEAGIVFGGSAAYTGNRGPNADQQVQSLRDITQSSGAAANVLLTIA